MESWAEMPQDITVVGAYGRTYRSLKAAQDDWDAGLDFKEWSGSYINKADYLKYGKGAEVWLRYGGQSGLDKKGQLRTY